MGYRMITMHSPIACCAFVLFDKQSRCKHQEYIEEFYQFKEGIYICSRDDQWKASFP